MMKSTQGTWIKDSNKHGGVSYECRVDTFVLSVTNRHIDYPGQWLASCYPLFSHWILDMPGRDEFAEDAQEAVLQMTIESLEATANTMRGIKL